MNDTETEVRRLLAVATEDMPPGIDLLDGLARARRQDRARRTRGRAVLSAGVATVAAAVTAIMLTIGSAPPALATVTTALARTLAQNYHLTETDSFFIIARDGQTHDSAAQTCAIAADPVHHLEASTCSKGTLSMREVGGYLYLNLLPGTKWDRVPAASFDRPWPPNLNGSATGATPQQMLSAIEKADKVTVAGSASGPGWTGTRYTISSRVSSTYTISGTLDVDQQGRARVLDLTTRWGPSLGVVQDLTFSDFGAQVTVTPPPADQTNITTVSHLPWPWNTNNFLF
jgi:hypothetical protein